MASKKFPATIYLKRENEGQGEDEYLGVFEDMESPVEDEKTYVAVYTLKQVLALKKKVVEA